MTIKEILEIKSDLETDFEILIEEFINKTNLIPKKQIFQIQEKYK